LLTNRIIFSVNSVIFSEGTRYCEASVRVKPRFACQELGLTTSHFKIFKKTKCPGLIITVCTVSTQVWKFNLAEMLTALTEKIMSTSFYDMTARVTKIT